MHDNDIAEGRERQAALSYKLLSRKNGRVCVRLDDPVRGVLVTSGTCLSQRSRDRMAEDLLGYPDPLCYSAVSHFLAAAAVEVFERVGEGAAA